MKFSSKNTAWFEPFINGDERAFTFVFQEYRRKMFVYAYKYLADPRECEEVVADTFYNLWNERTAIDNVTHLSSWLYLTTYRKCIDKLRKPANRPVHLEEVPDTADSDNYAMIDAELIARIERRIEALPPKLRKVLILRFRNGLLPQEIAKLMNTDINTVYSYTNRAIKTLRHHLADPRAESTVLLLITLFINHLL